MGTLRVTWTSVFVAVVSAVDDLLAFGRGVDSFSGKMLKNLRILMIAATTIY